ncbi:MAG: L-threonylcarbamoyladenylate synthase [Syntrophomonadaceae bacterium]|nr:L-threonylcarbamoyladenylate synthase [Syntrophomonadaceae bacterium]
MQTVYWQIDKHNPDKNIITQAAGLIMKEELVAFPTETVYGVGASAFSANAVEKIYIAKDRPPLNPLLVHISQLEHVQQLVEEVPEQVRRLMQHFWPGPLSIVLRARPQIPEIVRAGKPTVGLRMPEHRVAQQLIDYCGPLAATSANLSGRPSPVCAQDVKEDLHGRIAAVLDAGMTGLGVESTVLDMSSKPTVLRLGGVSIAELERVLGEKIETNTQMTASSGIRLHSLVRIADDMDNLNKLLQYYNETGISAAVVFWSYKDADYISNIKQEYYLQGEVNKVYSILRDAEKKGIEVLLFPPLPEARDSGHEAILEKIKQLAGIK